MGSEAIVIVEDEADLLDLISQILEEEGYNILRFSQPDAIRLENGTRPRVFLLDLMLPSMDGIELARSLRPFWEETPMIAMSASPNLLDAARRSGLFQATIGKPFDMLDLIDTVTSIAGPV